MYVRQSALCLRLITYVFINGFHSNFAYAFIPTMMGIVNGQKSIINHRVTALVKVKKMFLACSSFTIWSITMKFQKINQSNKSSILAKKFYHPRLSALTLGL